MLDQLVDTLRQSATAGGDSDSLVRAEAQRFALAQLQQRVAFASPADLQTLRAEVSASTAATQATIPQARAVSAASAQATEAALHAASAAAHREASSFVEDFYGKKIFDPYLRFASAEDEEAYRKREADRERAIREALAEGTPEGNLRALQLSRDQLKDAGAHGADQSPDYQPRLDRIETQIAGLSRNVERSRPVVNSQIGARGTFKNHKTITASVR